VVGSFLRRITLIRVLYKQMTDEVLALLTYTLESVVVKVELTLHDVADDFELVSPWEGHLTGQ
jgi:hypothetical protein